MAIDSPQAARQAAESILAQSRFRGSSLPDPLHGVLEWFGRVLSDPLGAVNHAVSRIGTWFPGGVAGVWALGAALLLGAVAYLSARRARTSLGRVPAGDAAGASAPTPGQLEREAAAAERAGRFDQAVRLRFRAGILRLGQRLDLPPTETTPNRAIAATLRSRRFDALATGFDRVAYGGAHATAADAERQRDEWPRLLTEVSGSR
jgi:hypothetical protein